MRKIVSVLTLILFIMITSGCNDETEKPDTTPPVITLIGEKNITITVGDKYTDAGATATDDRDGNIADRITITNDVNISKIGIYTVTYNVTDIAGNKAEQVNRIVKCIRAFGTEGPYLSKVKSIKTIEDDQVRHAIYYVEGVQNLPAIIFMSGWKSNLESYDGFLKYVSSLGYCVIAESERGKCFTPEVYEQNLTTQLNTAQNTYHADISKLGIMGHSSGGGTVHYLMNYFKTNGIAGTNKSVAISIDGWFPFGTTETMLNAFDSPTLLIQFGGLDAINKEGTHPDWDDYPGEPYHHYQDPKINMAIYKSLTHENVDKEYVVLEANNQHSYIAGNYTDLITKTDVLAPIDEFLNHTLGTGAPMTLINQYNDVITNDSASEYQYYCHTAGFDFCDLDNLVFP